jgi:uncharacterized protein YciI
VNPGNQYLYRLVPTRVGMSSDGPTEREAAIVGEHFAYLERLAGEGVVLMAGRTLVADERTFGIVVFTADSESAARTLMQGDPAVRAGVMQAELLPFRVALWSATGPDKGGSPNAGDRGVPTDLRRTLALRFGACGLLAALPVVVVLWRLVSTGTSGVPLAAWMALPVVAAATAGVAAWAVIGRERPARFGPARGMIAAVVALLLCGVAISLPYVVGLPPSEFLLFLVMTLSGALLWCGWYVLLAGAVAGWLLRRPGASG